MKFTELVDIAAWSALGWVIVDIGAFIINGGETLVTAEKLSEVCRHYHTGPLVDTNDEFSIYDCGDFAMVIAGPGGSNSKIISSLRINGFEE